MAAGRLRSRSFSPSGPTVVTGGGCEASPGNGEMAAGEQGGRDYLERHRIPELLRRLSALLLYHQPERPRQFLIQVLETVKAGRQGEGTYPCLMDESNLVAMFQMLDVADLGSITPVQYREALKTLGLSTDNLHVGDDENVTLDTFKEEVKKRLLEIWAVY